MDLVKNMYSKHKGIYIFIFIIDTIETPGIEASS